MGTNEVCLLMLGLLFLGKFVAFETLLSGRWKAYPLVLLLVLVTSALL